MIGKLEALGDLDRVHREDHVAHHHGDLDHDQAAGTLEVVRDRGLALRKRNLDDHEAVLDRIHDDSDVLDGEFQKTVIFLLLARSII